MPSRPTVSRIALRLWGSTPTVGSSRIEQLGPVQQTGGHVGPPFHAARVGRDPVATPVGQADQLEGLADAGPERPSGQTVELAEEREVLDGGQVGVQGQVLGDVADQRLGLEGAAREATDPNLAPVARRQPAQHGDGGGLAGPVGPEQAVALALGDGEGDTVDGDPVPVALAQASAAEHRGRPGRGPRPAGPGRFAHPPSSREGSLQAASRVLITITLPWDQEPDSTRPAVPGENTGSPRRRNGMEDRTS